MPHTATKPPPTPEQLAERRRRAAARRDRRNAKRREQRASPAHREDVAARRRLREQTQATVYEGRVLHLLELIAKGGAAPAAAAHFASDTKSPLSTTRP